MVCETGEACLYYSLAEVRNRYRQNFDKVCDTGEVCLY
jgi:hypothetical protein